MQSLHQEQTVQEFLHAFERAAATLVPEELETMYAPVVMVAGPEGARPINRDDLVRAIPKRKQMFAAAGCDGAKLMSFRHTELDQRYTMVHTDWRWEAKPVGRPADQLVLPATFILERFEGSLRIVVYFPHQDVLKVFRERGSISD